MCHVYPEISSVVTTPSLYDHSCRAFYLHHKEDHRLDSVLSIFSALWHHDAFALQNVNLLLLYFCLALLIFLESGFLPAAPLPCDSVIVLSGSLAATGVLQLHWVLITLFLAGWLGSLVAFYQGSQLKHWRIINNWLAKFQINN